jgi:hypothetical protein
LNAQNINTIAGNGTAGYSGDGGAATNACFNNQWGIAVDLKGNVYVGDRSNNRIRKINTAGIITTFAGDGGTGGYGGDGGAATNATFNYCPGVAVDNIGNVYIGDAGNNRIRKVNTNGIITTIAGNGTAGFSGDGGQATAANISSDFGIAVDSNYNVYIGDFDNFRIRQINTAGIINTIAGTGVFGYSGDGGVATNAQISPITNIAIDNIGNLYFIDSDGTTYSKLRKINTAGIINTIAGDSIGFSGDGGLAVNAKIAANSVIIDKYGNIFIDDAGNNRIRMINTNGIINTVVGNGTQGFSGDGGLAINAELDGPLGIALDSARNLYISDAGNNRIRKVDSTLSMGIQQYAANSMQVNVYPNPTTGAFYISTSNRNDVSLNVEVQDLTGRIISKQAMPVNNGVVTLQNTLVNGVYMINITGSDGKTVTQKLVVNN